MASQRQIDYIDILCNDCGFDTRAKKYDFLSNLLGYKVTEMEYLANPEVNIIIEELKEIKYYYDPRNQSPELDNFDPGDRNSAFRND